MTGACGDTGNVTADDIVLPTLTFTGDELFRLEERAPLPGSHTRATITVRYNPSEAAANRWGQRHGSGPGVYACFWDGRLFYVGTYAGKGADSRIGNVARERWSKHIAGMTFRGRRLGIAPKWLDKIAREHDGPLAQLLIASDRAVLGRDKGLQAQYSKYRFAERHWSDFEHLDQTMLGRFSFLYLRPSLSGQLKDTAKLAIDPHLRRIEREAILAFDPPCNDKSANNCGETKASIATVDDGMRAIIGNYIAQLESRPAS